MPLPQFTPQEPKDPITQEKERLFEHIKHIPKRIGIHAGKGGVGKTFIATQLALLAAKNGLEVGLIDADVDCPNVPESYNIQDSLRFSESGKLMPIVYKGVKTVSTGFMQDPENPIIIRGPIKHRLLTDFIEKTDWGALDILIFDFPPGTSDVPLSAMQVANMTGVVIVTTPQKSSLRDAKRAAGMARKTGVQILGVIENMSGEVFGEGAGEELAKELRVSFITSIPLSKDTRESLDKGELALNAQTQQALTDCLL